MAATLVALAAVLVLPLLYVAAAGRERCERGALFADCLGLFESYRVTQSGAGFPVLEGTFRGLPVKLEPVVDCVAWRKLPSLWLKVTLLEPNTVNATLDLLVRPQGVEFYSPSADLPYEVPLPAEWPQHAVLRTDDIGRMPKMCLLEPHMQLFADERMKELLVTPRGTRLVRQIAQAERSDYLVLRQARFTNARVAAATAATLLDSLLAISTSLNRAGATS